MIGPKGYGECRAGPLGRHLYRSAMPCRVHPDDRQAQAEAGDLLGAGGIGPVEGLKDMGRGVRRPICVAASGFARDRRPSAISASGTDPFHIRERRSAAGYVERIPCGLLEFR